MKCSSKSLTRRQLLRESANLVALSGVGLILAACGVPAPAASTVARAPAAGPVDLTIAAGWTASGWKSVWDLLLKTYTEKQPSVTLSIDPSTSSGQYDQTLVAQVAAGALPDVIYTADNYAAPFKQNRITQDMLPFARTASFPIDDFNKTFLDLGMVEGALHLLPISGDVVILFVNKRLVQEAGVQLPWTVDPASAQWSYDDFVRVCQRISVDAAGKRGDEPGFDKTNVRVYGASIDPTWWAIYVPAVASVGGQFVSDDLTRSHFNSPEGIAAIELLTKPVLDGFWAPLGASRTMGDPFTTGKAAIVDNVRGGIPSFRPHLKDDWDVIHFYRGPAKRVTGMGTQGFALGGLTKHPNEAWSFLDFLYGEDGMRIVASQYAAVPVQKRFYNAAWWKNLAPPPANNDVFTRAFDYGIVPPRLPFYTTGSFTKAIADGFSAVEQKQATSQQVAKSIGDELQHWLDQNKKQ